MTGLPPYEGHNPLRDTGVQRSADTPERLPDELLTPWRGDWGHELSQTPEVDRPVRRERLFSRKVLIGWAALTLALYFGVHMVKHVIGRSVRESARVNAARRAPGAAPNSRSEGVTILLPNGKRITINNTGAEISLPDAPPALPAPPAEPAPSATPAAPATKAPDIPPPAVKKH
ncbi:MAG: hypothetical protein ABI875_05120 [Gemmatimonadales bacterium]